MPLSPRAGLAYGLRLRGLDGRGLLADDGGDWPEVALDQAGGAVPTEPRRFTIDDALLELDGRRRLEIARRPPRAVVRGPKLTAEELLHPCLAVVAIAFGHWLGRQTFHAGAFLAGGGAWALVGADGRGKSTVLAALAARGVPVLTDDLLVLDGEHALAGPRIIDLRTPPAAAIGLASPVRYAREGARWRLALDPVAVSVPFRGWFFLGWSEKLSLTAVAPSTCLRRLAHWRGLPEYPSDPAHLLALAARPAWELRRPAREEAVEPSLKALLETAEDQPRHP